MISETNLKSGLKIRCSRSCKKNVALLCRAFKQSPDNEVMRADATQYTLLIILALNSFLQTSYFFDEFYSAGRWFRAIGYPLILSIPWFPVVV